VQQLRKTGITFILSRLENSGPGQPCTTSFDIELHPPRALSRYAGREGNAMLRSLPALKQLDEHVCGCLHPQVHSETDNQKIDAVSRVKLPVYYDFSLSSVRNVNDGTFVQI
jgi:hypothetical protein